MFLYSIHSQRFSCQVLLLNCLYSYVTMTIGKKTNRLSVKDSDKRVLRWQSRFDKICIEMFSLYSKNYESEHFSDDANHLLSPFKVHSAMLISVSQIILLSFNTGNLGRKTLKNVSEWFKLITSLAESRLGSFFDQQTPDNLMKIAQEY
jgi:hypothetical protein